MLGEAVGLDEGDCTEGDCAGIGKVGYDDGVAPTQPLRGQRISSSKVDI